MLQKEKRKIVLLRGKPTSGKSTAFNALKNRTELNGWAPINFPMIKSWFDNVDGGKELRKLALFAVMKEVMKTGKNILLEEMSRDTLNHYIGSSIRKYKYEICVFQFAVSLKTAYERDVQRANEGWHPFMGKKLIKEMHIMHDERFDKNAIFVDCEKLSKTQVIEFILKNLRF